ncbi:MAG: type I-E CRISPR-associated protein Cas6/Cse3/CasE [Deltaproteobacteria bacterium]|nr:type I-E CRISPR-associated protein Cas6/Cse3/CasE [Deltaproteobacteria bacterium]
MFLMRAFLNPDSPAVRSDLASPESLHKTVMRAFPDLHGPTARQDLAILHRLDHVQDGRLVLLVQSLRQPDPTRWPAGYVADVAADADFAFSHADNPEVRDVAKERSVIATGQRYRFRLKANTTKRLSAKSPNVTPDRVGMRVPVHGDDARKQWLARRASAAGFNVELDAVRTTEVPAAGGASGKHVTVAGTLFEGVLVVVDHERFHVALQHGIGPAKAYGYGLLSIATAR